MKSHCRSHWCLCYANAKSEIDLCLIRLENINGALTQNLHVPVIAGILRAFPCVHRGSAERQKDLSNEQNSSPKRAHSYPARVCSLTLGTPIPRLIERCVGFGRATSTLMHIGRDVYRLLKRYGAKENLKVVELTVELSWLRLAYVASSWLLPLR